MPGGRELADVLGLVLLDPDIPEDDPDSPDELAEPVVPDGLDGLVVLAEEPEGGWLRIMLAVASQH